MKVFSSFPVSTVFAISAVFLAVGGVTAATIIQEAYLKPSNTDADDQL